MDTAIWETATCKLGWEVMGVFPKGCDGTDVNGVDANADRTLIVSSDDFSSVNIYRYPILNNNHDCIRLTGHAEHVVRARWVNGPEPMIISAGGNDRTYI